MRTSPLTVPLHIENISVMGQTSSGPLMGTGQNRMTFPCLMAEEAPRRLGQNKASTHIHSPRSSHKTSKDIGKVNIESLRSPSGTDSWHDRNGYRSIKAIEGFLHHPEHGQIARISHIF